MKPSFGELIRDAKKRKKWLGRELAAKLEIDAGTLSRLENDNYKETPPPDLINRISNVLDIPQVTLLTALGYRVMAEDSPPYDDTAASIARAVAHWSPAKKRCQTSCPISRAPPSPFPRAARGCARR